MPRALGLTIVLALVIFFPSPFTVFAAADLVIDADRQLGLAQDAFDRGDYQRAAAEYERFVYFFPQDRRCGQALIAIGQSHFKAEDFEKAATAFQRLIDSPYGRDLTAGSVGVEAWMMLSRCRQAMGDRLQAVADMENLIVSTTDEQVKDQARYQIGWRFVEDGAFDPALAQFGKIGSANAEHYRLHDLSQAMAGIEDLPAKSPQTAGLLSLVPGAGYLYCERPADALVAFVLNVGLAVATVQAFNEDIEALGALTGIIGLGFYAGSIHGSVNAAHKYNKAKARGFIEELQQRFRMDLAISGASAGLAAVVVW